MLVRVTMLNGLPPTALTFRLHRLSHVRMMLEAVPSG